MSPSFKLVFESTLWVFRSCVTVHNFTFTFYNCFVSPIRHNIKVKWTYKQLLLYFPYNTADLGLVVLCSLSNCCLKACFRFFFSELWPLHNWLPFFLSPFYNCFVTSAWLPKGWVHRNKLQWLNALQSHWMLNTDGGNSTTWQVGPSQLLVFVITSLLNTPLFSGSATAQVFCVVPSSFLLV